jgi:hypothetical protein
MYIYIIHITTYIVFTDPKGTSLPNYLLRRLGLFTVSAI